MKKKEQEATPRAEKVENEFNALPAQDYPLDLTFRMLKTVVSMDDIEDVEQTQLRECESENVFKELKRLYTAEMEACSTERLHGGKVPLLRLIRKPGTKNKFWIIDGHHRYKAAKKAGAKEIAVEVADPKLFKVKNLDELHFLQARENATTQANRSTHDKFAAAEAVLKHHHHWTNNQIAKYCTISSAIVEAQRKRMEATGAIPKHEKPQAKAAAAVDNPENAKKSNRALAKELGVGEATVRRARQDSTKKNDAADPACLKCGKTLPPKRRKGLSYTAENGEKVKFCCRECVQAYAAERDLILDERNHILSAKPKLKPEAAEEVHATPEEEVQDTDSAALDKVSSRAQRWVESHKPKCFHGYDTVAELDERKEQNTRGWTIEQLAEFEEGVQAYEKSDRNKPYPRTSDWSDEKLEGFIYANERERISEREAKRNEEQKAEKPPETDTTGQYPKSKPLSVYLKMPEELARSLEGLYKRLRHLKTKEDYEGYDRGRRLWREKGWGVALYKLTDAEKAGWCDELDVETQLERLGKNVEYWEVDPQKRKKTGLIEGYPVTNSSELFDTCNYIINLVEPGIWISREQLENKDIVSLVEFIADFLGCQASLFSQLFAEKVKGKKNGSGNVQKI